jgi:hypothetical protein
MWKIFERKLSAKRIAMLREIDAIVELSDLPTLKPVGLVEANLGYGREYWAMTHPDYSTERSVRRFRHGRLIVNRDHIVLDRSVIDALGYAVTQIAVRY